MYDTFNLAMQIGRGCSPMSKLHGRGGHERQGISPQTVREASALLVST